MAKIQKPLTPDQLDKLAVKLIEYIQNKGMYVDVHIYVNGDKFSSYEHPGDIKRETKYGLFYVTKNVNVRDILEFCNPKTLSMTFEGPLNHAINYGDGTINEDIRKIFAEYGLWYEQGYAWSLTAYYD